MPEDESVPATNDPIAWYDHHAGEAVSRYESSAPDKINEGRRLAISFRQPDSDRARSMFPCHLDEFEKLARDHGSILEKSDKTTDEQTRPGLRYGRRLQLLRLSTGTFRNSDAHETSGKTQESAV
jgi:hypothetical protein